MPTTLPTKGLYDRCFLVKLFRRSFYGTLPGTANVIKTNLSFGIVHYFLYI